MKAVYAMEPITGPAIFLAGPTPRSQAVSSWRPAAIQAMSDLGFTDTLLIPEDRSGKFHGDYLGQIDWETEGLQSAVCIMFWVPRALPDMPAFTTNDEWGFWKASGKVVFGAPNWAEKVRYQQLYCERHGIPSRDSLRDTCAAAIKMFEQLYEPELSVAWP